MRIHTNTLNMSDVTQALRAVQVAGLVDPSVHFHILTTHGSRKRARAFEVQLGTHDKLPGDGRSWKNTGTYGADDVYAATYDEWGYFLAALFLADEDTWMQYHQGIDQFIKNTSTKRNARQKCFDYITPVREALGLN